MNSTILIYGSCVSRDPFDHPIVRQADVSISTYISKTGTISQASAPAGSEIELPNTDDFLTRMVRIDARKLAKEKMKEHKADWLLLDFVDDRIPLIKTQESYYTASRGFVLSGLDKALTGSRFDPVDERNFAVWEASFSVMAKAIRDAGFSDSQIILHRAWWARFVRNGNFVSRFDEATLAECSRQNLFLGKIYREVKKHFPKCHHIEIPKDMVKADANHKWGPDPYHFVPEYNEEFANQLLGITRGIVKQVVAMPKTVVATSLTPTSVVNRRLAHGVSIYDKIDARDPVVREYGITRPYLSHVKERVEKFKDTGIIFDDAGVPRNLFRWGGPYYYSVTIGHHGLSCVSRYVLDKNEADRAGAVAVARWLIETQADNGSWPVLYDHDWYPNRCDKLKAPWTSAMGQGLCISFLTRFSALNPSEVSTDAMLAAAERAVKPFMVPVSEGGVRTMLFDRFTWYEEYPTKPSSFVLNGFIYAILGLYDFAEFSGNLEAKEAYRDGVESLKAMLPLYDLGRCTAYDLTHVTTCSFAPNIARQSYHFIHVQLLSALNLIEGGIFTDVVERWKLYLEGWGAKHN